MRTLLISALLATATAAAPAHAWSKLSHMTTGAIAYDDLARTSPDLIPQIEEILKAHPHYKKLLANTKDLTGAARTRAMFEWLARWPDDIRGTDYSKPKWHYELRVVYGRTWLWPFRNGSAGSGFETSFKTLSDTKAKPENRAIALGWLMHLVGDIQQPLHAGHQMTSTYPATDEAGQLAFVKRTKDGNVTNLHEYWDEMLDVEGEQDATSKKWAGTLQTLWPREKLAELNGQGTANEQFYAWMDESKSMARISFYKGTILEATPEPENAPVVTSKELRVAKELSKRRVATGGYRIADTIRMALKPKVS